MIESVKLIRFKQFRETEVELPPFGILMGGNNAGKTTVLQAVWLALHSLHQGKLLVTDRKTLQTKVSSTGYYTFDVPFLPKEDLNGLFYKKIARGSATYDENSGAIVELTDEKHNVVRLHMRELFRNLNVKVLTPEEELHGPTMQKQEPLYISCFSGLRPFEERLFPAVLKKQVGAGMISANIRNVVLDLKLKAPEKYAYLERILREETGFELRELHFYESSELYVVSEYEEKRDGERICLEFGSCGSGSLQMLQVLSMILRYCPERASVVLIDEPEAHLTAKGQVIFTRLLRRLQEKLQVQILLATNSEPILMEAQSGELVPVTAKTEVNRSLGGMEELSEEELSALLGGKSGDPELTELADMAEELLTPHVLGQIRLTGKVVFWDTAQAEVICRMEELLQPGFFGERPQVDFFDAGAYRELPYLLAPLLARLTGRTVEVHIVKDGTGLTDTAKGGLREFASEHGAIWHIIEEKPEQCLWNTEVFLGALQADTANRGKDLPSAAELQEEMDAQPQALLTYLIRSLRRRGLRISPKALVNSLQRESIPDAYAELFVGLQGEEESFEDYAPKAVRIPGAHYEQMSLF